AGVDQQEEVVQRVAVLKHVPERTELDARADLLEELAGERLGRRLARLDLAAGQLPLVRKRLIGAASGEQNTTSGAADQAGDDERADGGSRGGHGVPVTTKAGRFSRQIRSQER